MQTKSGPSLSSRWCVLGKSNWSVVKSQTSLTSAASFTPSSWHPVSTQWTSKYSILTRLLTLVNSLFLRLRALMTAVKAHYEDPNKPYPSQDNPMMYELTSFLDSAGMSDPLTKIYITTKYVCDGIDSYPISFNFLFFVSGDFLILLCFAYFSRHLNCRSYNTINLCVSWHKIVKIINSPITFEFIVYCLQVDSFVRRQMMLLMLLLLSSGCSLCWSNFTATRPILTLLYLASMLVLTSMRHLQGTSYVITQDDIALVYNWFWF